MSDELFQKMFGDSEPTHMGTGWVSGTASVFFGMLALGGVLTLHFRCRGRQCLRPQGERSESTPAPFPVVLVPIWPDNSTIMSCSTLTTTLQR